MEDFKATGNETDSLDMEESLFARRAEVKSLEDLELQRGTAIPALFSTMFKFIANPSSISVETFKRMVDTDDTVGSGVDFLVTCLVARLGRYTHKNPQISEFVNDALSKIEGGWTPAVKEILTATWSGFYIGEKVWANTDKGFIIQRLASLPPSTVLFEVDRVGRITTDGVLQYQRNWIPGGFGQTSGFAGSVLGIGSNYGFSGRPDPFARVGDLPFPVRSSNMWNYMSIRIPVTKVVHYAFDAQGKFGNPYGRSLLRRCYKWWVLKDTFMRQMAVALDRKGTPLTVVYADNNTTVLDQDAARGGPPPVRNTPNQRGKRGPGRRADEAAADAFANIDGKSVIILPGKKGGIFDVDSISQESNTDAFKSAIEMCDRAILRALLLPALIFGSGDGSGSYALGQEHAKTFDKICDGVLSGLTDVLLHQMVFELIAYNFPHEMWKEEGFGEFSKRELTTDERNKELETLKSMDELGALDMEDLNDLNVVRERGGLAPRDKPIPRPEMILPGGEDGLDDGVGGKTPFGIQPPKKEKTDEGK